VPHRGAAVLRRLDLPQALTVAALLVLGLMTLYSTSRPDFATQLSGAVLGLALCVAAAAFDYRRLQAAAPFLYGLALLLLLTVEVAGRDGEGPRVVEGSGLLHQHPRSRPDAGGLQQRPATSC